ncbi:hypothetical protein EWM64_g8488 [Hericium alpestre]|uniref:Uncharacterized protein n=1 Tax=Hericium alpestre TaxID=135208 RepID=A0A4Y9ZMP2_9AGAM|nr:hypothetical protein EWM64_g8488 [Hericium alpestre]
MEILQRETAISLAHSRLNINTEINCGAWLISTTLFGDLSLITASALLALRTIAVWNRKIYVVIPVVATWLAGSIVELYNGTRTSGAIAWDQTSRACSSTNDPTTGRWYATAAVTSDAIILPIMLVGLHIPFDADGKSRTDILAERDLGRVLDGCGDTFARLYVVGSQRYGRFLGFKSVPFSNSVVRRLGAMNLIYQPIAALIMVIAATRLHRNLSTFLTGPITYSTDQPDTGFHAAIPLTQASAPSSHVVVDFHAHAHAPRNDKGEDTASGVGMSPRDDKPVREDMDAV